MSDSAIQFSETDLIEDPDYRSLSITAVVAFVVALFSPAAITTPVLWALPLVVIAIAAIALFRIQRRAGELSGAVLAKLAIVIAITFGVYAPIRHFSRDAILFRLAREFADEFFGVIGTGRFRDAFLLHVPIEARKDTLLELETPLPKKPDDPQANSMDSMMEQMSGAVSEENRFLSSDLLRHYQGTPKPEVEYVGSYELRSTPPHREIVTLLYRAAFVGDSGQRESKVFQVVLQRVFDSQTRTGYWQFDEVREFKPK